MTARDEPSETLARDAALWFARMRSPEAEAQRDRFEAWLAHDPDHRVAYNRAGEIFALGKLLAEAPAPPAHARRTATFGGLVAVMTCVLAAALWFGMRPSVTPPRIASSAHAPSNRLLITEAGEERLARLEDGSTVMLSGDSRLDVAFGQASRILRLLHGSARFDVRHESRPFIVQAGGGSVTARGTLFDVALTASHRVEVRLLRGAIDVQLPRRAQSEPAPVRRLEAGESIAYLMPPPARGASLSAPTALPPVPTGGLDVRNLESVPVRLLLAEANRQASRPIRLADASIGDERVSGRLRLDDSARLARQLSTLFGLSVDTHDPKEIVLKP